MNLVSSSKRPLFMPGAAKAYKDFLRSEHWKEPVRSYGDARDKAVRFWTIYEQVNRDYLPMDPVYSIVRSTGGALSTTADNLNVQAASTGEGRTLEIIIGGEAAASAVNRVVFQRSTAALVGQAALTPEKFNSLSPAAAGVYSRAGTQALSGSPLLVFSFNAFGGFVDWKAAPGEEANYVNGLEICLRSDSGISPVASTIVFEEL